MTRLILVRHGQTDWNVARRLQGSSDIPLNDIGRAQAVAAREGLWAMLRGEPVFVSSHLGRAVETAAILCEGRVDRVAGGAVTPDARLAERSYGAWEGLEADQREVLFPEDYALWASGHEPRIEGYETHAILDKRVSEAAREWVESVPRGTDVVFVSHGSAGRMLLLALLGLPTTGRVLGHMGNASWSRLGYAPASGGEPARWTLERHNVGVAGGLIP